MNGKYDIGWRESRNYRESNISKMVRRSKDFMNKNWKPMVIGGASIMIGGYIFTLNSIKEMGFCRYIDSYRDGGDIVSNFECPNEGASAIGDYSKYKKGEFGYLTIKDYKNPILNDKVIYFK